MSTAPSLYRLATDTIGAATTDLNRQRPYVPKTSRCLVLRSPQTVTVSSTRLLQRAIAAGAGDLADPLAAVASVVLPTEWWLPDSATGTRLVAYKLSAAAPHDVGCTVASEPLPAGGRIGSVLEVDGGRQMAVSDTHGRVSVMPMVDDQTWARLMPDAAGGSGGPSAKKPRGEGSSAAAPTAGPWRVVADPHAASPQRGAMRPLGVAGWAGLLATGHFVLAAREHYKDVRLLDLHSGAVVATFHATHTPTSMAWTVGEPVASTLVTLADGPVLTTFDTRAPACAQRLSLRPGVVAWSVTRLGTSAPYAMAVSDTARRVALYDVRKWTITDSISSVLKHACVGITPAGRQGLYVACTGLDSELRIVAPSSKAEAAPPAGASDEPAEGPTASTFRTRIDTTVHCNAAWFGDWASMAAGDDGAAQGTPACVMAGVSSTNEVFVAIQT